MESAGRSIGATIDAHFAREVAFLKELIRAPSDNPPGDCAAHAEAAAAALTALGFEVERHAVAEPLVREAGMISITNLSVRKQFGRGGGPAVALNAHGD